MRLGNILTWTWLFVYYFGIFFDLDMIVCVLYWGEIWLGHDCLCIMHSLNQYMVHDFVWAVNVQEELVILLLLVWILWSFFSFEITSVELYMFQFVHPFSETCFLFRLNCNEAVFFFCKSVSCEVKIYMSFYSSECTNLKQNEAQSTCAESTNKGVN